MGGKVEFPWILIFFLIIFLARWIENLRNGDREKRDSPLGGLFLRRHREKVNCFHEVARKLNGRASEFSNSVSFHGVVRFQHDNVEFVLRGSQQDNEGVISVSAHWDDPAHGTAAW